MNSTSLKLTPAVTLISLGSLLILVVGCRVGPNYVRPPVTAPEVYRGADEASVSSADQESVGDQKWTQVFHEPELQDLIRAALENNYDGRIAAQRVLEAQAQLRIIRSQQFPTVTVGGTGIGADLGSSVGNGLASGAVAAGTFNISAAWTPDFWGLYRRQTEATAWPSLGAARGAHNYGPAGGNRILSFAVTRRTAFHRETDAESQAGFRRPHPQTRVGWLCPSC